MNKNISNRYAMFGEVNSRVEVEVEVEVEAMNDETVLKQLRAEMEEEKNNTDKEREEPRHLINKGSKQDNRDFSDPGKVNDLSQPKVPKL
jgi:hypothetical protein